MENRTLSQRADYQRIALLTELASIADVVSWADDEIARSDIPQDALIEIALGRTKPIYQLEMLLRSLVVDRNDTSALKDVLSRIAQAVRDGEMGVDTAIVNIHEFLEFDQSNEDLYFSFVGLEDDVSCIRGGVYGDGDISVLRAPLLEILDSYCGEGW